MGLGKLFTRSTVYTATDTVSGASATYTVVNNLGPDFPSPTQFRGALSIPAAWRATSLLTNILGQVPYELFEEFERGGEPWVRRIWPDPLLLDQPAPPDARITTFSAWGMDLIWNGNALGVWADPEHTAVVPVASEFVDVRRVPRDDPYGSGRPPGTPEYRIGDTTFGPDEIFHVKGLGKPGALRGMGVLEHHFETFGLAIEQRRQATGISHHGVPTGVIQSDDPDLVEADAIELKRSWMEGQATRTPAVLNHMTKWQSVSWNPEEMQMIDARRFTNSDMELIFGLPVGWLGGMTSPRQYSNVEMDAVNVLKFSVGGHVSRFEQTLSLAFPRNRKVWANLDEILRADTLTRFQAHEIGIRAGFETEDEARRVERKAPLPAAPEKPAVSDEFTSGPGNGQPPQ